MLRVHAANLPCGDPLFDGAHQPRVEGAQVLARNPREIRSGFHCFALYEARVVGMRRKKIEITGSNCEQSCARRKAFTRRAVNPLSKLAEKIFEHGAVKAAFVAEIVV